MRGVPACRHQHHGDRPWFERAALQVTWQPLQVAPSSKLIYACVLGSLLRKVSDWASALQLPANAMVVYENAEDVITAQGEPEQVGTGSGTAGAQETGVCEWVWVNRRPVQQCT